MEYRIEEGPELRLAGIGIRATSKDGSNLVEIPAFWDKIMVDGRFKALASKSNPRGLAVCGICRDFDMKEGTFTYDIAIDEPASMEGMPVCSERFTVPASTWGKFKSRGPIRPNFQEMMRKIFAEWLPSSEWEISGSAEVEFYPEGNTESEDYWCEFWLPLKRGRPSQ